MEDFLTCAGRPVGLQEGRQILAANVAELLKGIRTQLEALPKLKVFGVMSKRLKFAEVAVLILEDSLASDELTIETLQELADKTVMVFDWYQSSFPDKQDEVC